MLQLFIFLYKCTIVDQIIGHILRVDIFFNNHKYTQGFAFTKNVPYQQE